MSMTCNMWRISLVFSNEEQGTNSQVSKGLRLCALSPCVLESKTIHRYYPIGSSFLLFQLIFFHRTLLNQPISTSLQNKVCSIDVILLWKISQCSYFLHFFYMLYQVYNKSNIANIDQVYRKIQQQQYYLAYVTCK